MNFIRDTRHLWILLLLLIVGGAGAVMIRSQMIPETYGDASGRYGPYRAAALKEIAAQPSVLIADSVCHQCHQDVEEERVDSMHKAVRCIHCHGANIEHVDQARKADKSPGSPISPAEKWDGNFLTKIDLYVTKDQKTCLVCHEYVIGMPKDFRHINVVDHLDEQGASEPESPETCFECHGGHDTAP